MALKISTHLQFPSPATKLHYHRVFSEQPHYHLPQLNILFPNNQLLLRRGSKNVGFRGVVVRSMAGGLEPQTETKGRPEMFVKESYSPPSWASELHPAPSHFVSLGQVNIITKRIVRSAHWRVRGHRMWNYVLHIGVTFFFSVLRGVRAVYPSLCKLDIHSSSNLSQTVYWNPFTQNACHRICFSGGSIATHVGGLGVIGCEIMLCTSVLHVFPASSGV